MKGEDLLKIAMKIIEDRRAQYGDSTLVCKKIAARWSQTLGVEITPAAAVMCLIDLKMARLHHNPTHLDSIIDIAGYAAILAEVTQEDGQEKKT